MPLLMMIIIMTMMMLMVVVVPSSGLQGFSQRAHPRSLRDLRVIEQSGTPIGGCSIGFAIQGFNDGRNAVLTGWTEVRVSSPYRKRQDAKPASRASKIQLRHSVTWCSARRCRMKSRPDLGDATFIANTADVTVRNELRKLYTRDPDWNLRLPEFSDTIIGAQQSLQDFSKGFSKLADEIPLNTIRPALSTVVYRTRCDVGTCEQVKVATNEAAYTVVVVTARRVPLAWTDCRYPQANAGGLSGNL